MTLELEGVGVRVEGEPYLHDIDLVANAGEITVLFGRTGSGKTSLMRVVAGLLPPDEGAVRFGGTDMTAEKVWKRDVAMVYQQFINYPNRTARQNVEFPLKKAGLKGSELQERVERYLRMVGLSDLHDRKPGELSGGQQQRVALARSLARQSRILMLDEPLMNLDFKLREQLREDFVSIFKQEHSAVTLYATTEVPEAMMLANKVAIMHEGRILQQGAPADVFDRPKNRLVATIMAEPPMNIIAGRLEDGEIKLLAGQTIPTPTHLGRLGSGQYDFGVRANNLVLSSPHAGVMTGAVTFTEMSGSETIVHLAVAGQEVIVQVEGIQVFSIGEALSVEIDSTQVFAFAPDGDLLGAPSVGVV